MPITDGSLFTVLFAVFFLFGLYCAARELFHFLVRLFAKRRADEIDNRVEKSYNDDSS